MKFKREFLDELSGSEIVSTQPMFRRHRWYSISRVIFRHDGKFYETLPRVPASELQEDMEPYDDEEIECLEVVPVEKAVIVYEAIKP